MSDRGASSGDEPDTVRRKVVNWLLGTSAGAVLASILYPVVRYVVPPESGQSASSQVTLDVTADEMPPDSSHVFKFGAQPGILIRTPGGELRAFSAVCTHLSCTVQYRDDLDHIWCPCHNGHFDLRGRNIQGPPPEPLPEYSVNVQDGEIVVSRA